MKQNRRLALFVLLAAAMAAASYSVWTRTRAPETVAIADSYPVYIALLKGFQGDVIYVGSDDRYAYFRLGGIFWSYYKLLSCAAAVPETFSVHAGNAYAVKLVVRDGKIVRSANESHCAEDFSPGQLERE